MYRTVQMCWLSFLRVLETLWCIGCTVCIVFHGTGCYWEYRIFTIVHARAVRCFFLFLFSSFFFASEFAIVFFMITLNDTYLCFMVVLCAVLKCAVRSRNSDLHFMYMYTLLTTFWRGFIGCQHGRLVEQGYVFVCVIYVRVRLKTHTYIVLGGWKLGM